MSSRLARVSDWPVLAMKAQYNAKEFARLCNISLRQLERYCRQSFEQPPQALFNAVRLDEAARRLLRGLTVKETAFSLGFKQTSHFCREFKRQFGVTPNSFVKKKFQPGHQNVAER